MYQVAIKWKAASGKLFTSMAEDVSNPTKIGVKGVQSV